jgi:tripartite-type tricarboxylate transporter receptor subunit TctC
MGRIIPKQALRTKGDRISVKVRTEYKKNLLLVILILGSFGLGQGLQAQEYPVRPITLLIGNPPGAGTDLCARVIAQVATKTLGQEIIPVNKAGGTGAVAAGILANAKGDGYTLLASVSSSFTSIPHLRGIPWRRPVLVVASVFFTVCYSIGWVFLSPRSS